LDLEPIDIETVVEKNKNEIFILENEAMDFIEHTFKTYCSKQSKVDMFVASFSGGKDSQVGWI
jgi:phosphoadenosine phosphosulfate reductase